MFGKNLWTVVAFVAALVAESGAVPLEGLVAFYPFSESFENTASTEIDSSENHGATFAKDRFGNENSSAYFDGNETFLEIPDNDAFSISTTGALTISVWVSPEVLNFQKAEAGGYVHWMGKGVPTSTNGFSACTTRTFPKGKRIVRTECRPTPST